MSNKSAKDSKDQVTIGFYFRDLIRHTFGDKNKHTSMDVLSG